MQWFREHVPGDEHEVAPTVTEEVPRRASTTQPNGASKQRQSANGQQKSGANGKTVPVRGFFPDAMMPLADRAAFGCWVQKQKKTWKSPIARVTAYISTFLGL